MFWNQKIADLEAEIKEYQSEIEDVESEARSFFQYGKLNIKNLPDYFSNLLSINQNKLTSSLQQQCSLPEIAGWQDRRWKTWQVSPDIIGALNYSGLMRVAGLLRVGEWVEERTSSEFSKPELIPFIGKNKTIVICSNNKTREQGLELLQSLVIRITLLLPHQVRYTFCDPASNGGAFLMRRSLPEGLVRQNSGELYRDLLEIVQDIRRIKENYLDAEAHSLELLRPEIRINERFEGIFAADFPKRYDRRDIEELQKIGSTGPAAGKYLFVHYNKDVPLPRDVSINGFENAVFVDIQRSRETQCYLQFKPDPVTNSELQKFLLNTVSKAKPPERKLNWDELVGQIPLNNWWSEKSTEIIKTPIAGVGSEGAIPIWFGKNNDGRQCAHGMLGAMTGSGKSTLYHVLILGLSIRYSPAELRLYLIDGKQGVEFAPYKHLPHTEVISLHSSPEMSRSILTELIEEKERRNSIFKQCGVSEFSDYRKSSRAAGLLPRILLLVDEYQELFEGDKDDIASAQMLTLAQQGRSAGIHMLLASQRFGAVGMRNQTGIFGNIHLRMGMKMSLSDIQALTEFGRKGKQLLMTCDIPGKIVVNDSSGDDSSNSVGKVAFLEKEYRDQLIHALVKKSHDLESSDRAKGIVFDGDAQPNLIENPLIQRLLKNNTWLKSEEWESIARKSLNDDGLNIVDWFSAEHPKIIWIGQEFSVRKQASIILRRRASEHVLIIGVDFHTARYGMLSSVLMSLAMNSTPTLTKFIVFDRSIPGTQWHSVLENCCQSVLKAAGFAVSFHKSSKSINSLFDVLIKELDRRTQLDEEDLISQASIFVLMTELDRVDDLRRQGEGYSISESPLSEKFRRLYVEGASKGIHLILSFSGVKAMANVLDLRKGLPNFRHRVALQISEDDSFTFVKDRKASQLQSGGSTPINALYKDMDSDRTVQFKPYSTESTVDFSSQLEKIGNRLIEWSNK